MTTLDAGRSYAGPERRADNPRWELVAGSALIIGFFGFLGTWAALAPLDAAASAPGVVITAGHRQTVQTRDVGTVTGLYVKEGDRVAAGQLLVQLGNAEAAAAERTISARVAAREAEVARLDAEAARSATLARPADFANLQGDERADAEAALAEQQRELTAQLQANGLRRAVLRQRVAEVAQQVSGYSHEIAANERQHAINDQELTSMRTLEEKGYAPASQVLALERSAASLDGEEGAQRSEVARLHGVAAEAELEIVQSDSQRAREISDEREKAQEDLQGLLLQQKSARETLARTQLRAPVAGSVLGLGVNTIGAVVGPGQRIMDIVPDTRRLVVESHVLAQDAAGIRVGQTAEVRLSSLGKRDAPLVHGAVERISADSQVDEKSGRAFYTAEIAIPASELAKLDGAAGAGGDLRPGLPAQVLIVQRKRSALQYILEPLTQTFWGAMRER